MGFRKYPSSLSIFLSLPARSRSNDKQLFSPFLSFPSCPLPVAKQEQICDAPGRENSWSRIEEGSKTSFRPCKLTKSAQKLNQIKLRSNRGGGGLRPTTWKRSSRHRTALENAPVEMKVATCRNRRLPSRSAHWLVVGGTQAKVTYLLYRVAA